MYFLRLIRPVNLIVIALTMYAVRVFFLQNSPVFKELNHSAEPFDYFLLVFSTMLIAAGGNIINDYFDVKADRINKPEKQIIGKFMKPRWAIVAHWTFNFVAFTIAGYLSWRYRTFWYVFVHLLTINALWFYSMHFKRRFLIGNLIIAGLTALVPILCGIHFYIQTRNTFNPDYLPSLGNISGEEWLFDLFRHGLFIYVIAIFAFSLNFIREIIKDMEDIPGDLVLKAKTLPIVLGIDRTKWISIVLLLVLTIISSVFIYSWNTEWTKSLKTGMIPLIVIAFFVLSPIMILLRSTEKKNLKHADMSLKIAMFLGCCIPYYWYFVL